MSDPPPALSPYRNKKKKSRDFSTFLLVPEKSIFKADGGSIHEPYKLNFVYALPIMRVSKGWIFPHLTDDWFILNIFHHHMPTI